MKELAIQLNKLTPDAVSHKANRGGFRNLTPAAGYGLFYNTNNLSFQLSPCCRFGYSIATTVCYGLRHDNVLEGEKPNQYLPYRRAHPHVISSQFTCLKQTTLRFVLSATGEPRLTETVILTAGSRGLPL